MKVDGDFELVGPFVADLGCTIGQDCSTTLLGYRLAESNQMVRWGLRGAHLDWRPPDESQIPCPT